jgi:hypothetical protein
MATLEDLRKLLAATPAAPDPFDSKSAPKRSLTWHGAALDAGRESTCNHIPDPVRENRSKFHPCDLPKAPHAVHGAEAYENPLKRATWNLERCEYCPCVGWDVRARSAATAYSWNGEGENPNRDIVLCDTCSADYYEHWEEQWAEYHRGLL